MKENLVQTKMQSEPATRSEPPPALGPHTRERVNELILEAMGLAACGVSVLPVLMTLRAELGLATPSELRLERRLHYIDAGAATAAVRASRRAMFGAPRAPHVVDLAAYRTRSSRERKEVL